MTTLSAPGLPTRMFESRWNEARQCAYMTIYRDNLVEHRIAHDTLDEAWQHEADAVAVYQRIYHPDRPAFEIVNP